MVALRDIVLRTGVPTYSTSSAPPPSHLIEYKGFSRYEYKPIGPVDNAREAAERAKAGYGAWEKGAEMLGKMAEPTSINGRGFVAVSMNSTNEGNNARRAFGVSGSEWRFDYGGYNVTYT